MVHTLRRSAKIRGLQPEGWFRGDLVTRIGTGDVVVWRAGAATLSLCEVEKYFYMMIMRTYHLINNNTELNTIRQFKIQHANTRRQQILSAAEFYPAGPKKPRKGAVSTDVSAGLEAVLNTP